MGIMGIALVIMAGLGLWHKAETTVLNLRISSLKSDIIDIEGKASHQKTLNEACELNLSGANEAISYQNNRIDDLQAKNAEMSLKSNNKAVAVLTNNDDLTVEISKELNIVMDNALAGGIQ